MKAIFLAGDELWFRKLPAALALKDAGAEVILMAPFQRYGALAESEGYRTINWNLSRGSLNPFREVRSLIEVLNVYRCEQPDLVHHIALKSAIYGGVAARLCKLRATVATITGLGRAFTISTYAMRLFRAALCTVLRFSLRKKNCKVTFENHDDLELFVNLKIVERQATKFVPGMGIDIHHFSPVPESLGIPIVLLPSRMLWEKGVGLFVEAALQLKRQGYKARFVLVGSPDRESRSYIPEAQLQAWAENGIVEWWGSNGDMPATFGQANIICLPTYYREGIPRVLMEASASARAVVTTDMPGCRYAIRNGENGLLIQPHDLPSLVNALAKLLSDEQLRRELGSAGRARAIREFSEPRIIGQIFELYGALLSLDRSEASDKMVATFAGRLPNEEPTQPGDDARVNTGPINTEGVIRHRETPQNKEYMSGNKAGRCQGEDRQGIINRR